MTRLGHIACSGLGFLNVGYALTVRSPEEFVKPLGISQAELAVRLGISYPRLNEIVRGKRGITPNTALRLTRVVGMSPEFWLGLQLDFDLWQAMHSSEAQSIASLKSLRRPRTAKVG